MHTSATKRYRKWFIRQIIAALIMIAISLLGWLRLIESIRLWDFLIELGLNPHPLYLAITGGLMGIFFTIAAINLLICHKRVVFFTRLCSILLAAWLIFDHLLLSHVLQTASDWIWQILLSSLFITLVFVLTSPIKQIDTGTVDDGK